MMRGGRSLAILMLIALGFGAYLYFVESKRDPADSGEKRAKIFAVEADKIEEITVKSESGDRTTLKKDASGWQLAAAESGAKADAAEASGISTNLATLEQQRLIDENPADLKDFGLDKPRIEVAFKAAGQQQTLLIGAKAPTGSDLYAKVAGKPAVFLIAAYLESTFNRSAFDLRDKTALRVDPEKVDAMEVVTAARTMRFAKGNGAWRLETPAEPRVDAVAVDGAVSRVLNAQMKSVAPPKSLQEYGLDKPAVTARVITGSSHATLLFGQKAEDGSVYAKDEARPEVFLVDAAIADDLRKDPAEYRQKDLFDARSFNTTKVEVVRGTETLTFEKKTEKDKDGKEVEKWRQSGPSTKDADADKVNALLSAVTGARASGFAATAGAATPALTVALSSDGKEERVTFLKSGADAFAVRTGSTGAAKIDAAVVDDIVKALDALR